MKLGYVDKLTSVRRIVVHNFEQIIGSFAQTHCFPRAVAYLDSGKVNLKGMVRCARTVL